MAKVKTNALRQLDTAGIAYETVEYEVDENDLSGVHVAETAGIDPDMTFKTLVCRNEKSEPVVFCIPVTSELDLKKCARAAGAKSVSMVPVKELLALTGYVRGGCSPVGMKKKFPTYFDELAELYDEIYCSAGVRGMQMKVSVSELLAFTNAKTADITE